MNVISSPSREREKALETRRGGTHVEQRPTAERFSFEKYFGLALFDHDRCWDSRMVDFRNPHLTGEFHPDTVTSASLPALCNASRSHPPGECQAKNQA